MKKEIVNGMKNKILYCWYKKEYWEFRFVKKWKFSFLEFQIPKML